MTLKIPAIAGTLESSDAQVAIEPCDVIDIDIQSNVLNQYGRQIKRTVLETLERLQISGARVTVVDKGALDCTLKARVECAAFRSAECEEYPWGGMIR